MGVSLGFSCLKSWEVLLKLLVLSGAKREFVTFAEPSLVLEAIGKLAS